MITFGNYTLDSTNNIYVRAIREKSPAERSLSIMKAARNRGVNVISYLENAKTINIIGRVVTDNVGTSFIEAIRTFNEMIMQTNVNLLIINDSGSFVYENCYVLDPQSAMVNDDYFNLNYIDFSIDIIAPAGICLENTTINTSWQTESNPFDFSYIFDGNTRPDPIFNLTINTANGMDGFNLNNITTNESIEVSRDTAFTADDIISVDTKNKTVKLNSIGIDFDGVLPRCDLGSNSFEINFLKSGMIDQQQLSYDGEKNIYGDNWFSQEFQVSASQTYEKIELLLKRIDGLNWVLYDDCNDSSVDATKWEETANSGTTIHEMTEDTSRLRMHASGSGGAYTRWAQKIANNNGFKINLSVQTGEGGNGNPRYFDLGLSDTDNYSSSYIKINLQVGVGEYGDISGGGAYSAISGNIGLVEGNTAYHTYEIYTDGADTVVKVDGVEKARVVGVSVPSNSYFISAITTAGGSAQEGSFYIDYLYDWNVVNANSNLDIRIETDNGGVPSGTPVANGTATIISNDVSNSTFNWVSAVFATEPTLNSGTVYHLVVKQTSGSSENYYIWKYNSTNGYALGNNEISINAGSSWSSDTGDMTFKIYGTMMTGHNVTLEIDYQKSYHNAD